MQTNQKQLNDLLRLQQKNELSSQQQDNVSQYQHNPASRSGFRKPIKNPFSDQSEQSDSQTQQNNNQKGVSPFPPKPPQQTKSLLQQAQQTMKWNKDQQQQIDILSKLQGQGMKDKKIRQLANKYKTLNIAYEKQRTLRKNLQTQLNTQLKVNQQSRNKSNEKQNTIKTLDKSLVKQNSKCVNPACLQLQKKVMQFRLQAQNLKTQLNKAHRVITRQIGQNFNIDQVLNDDNAWKGRQQKIQKLKGRVKQLQDKLVNNGVNVSHMSGFTQMSSVTRLTNNNNNTNNNFSSTRTSTMAQNKRKQFDNLKVQVQALKSDNQILQGKVKSLTSRKVILQNQMKQLKGQYEKKKQILLQKSQNDDKFINLLKNQNEKLKKQQRVITKVVYKDQKDNDQVNNLKRQLQKLKLQLKKSQRQVILSKEKQQKCIESVNNNEKDNDDKIQIKFPPTQKRKSNTFQRPISAKKSQSSINEKSQRQISADKKKQLQNQYLKSNKYLKKLTPQQQISIYESWKSGKKMP